MVNFMGRNIDLKNFGIDTNFDFSKKNLDLMVDTVKRLRYCEGVADGEYQTTVKYFREQTNAQS